MKLSRWLLFLGFALTIFGAKLGLLQFAGSDLPVLDQWDAECAHTLRPWLQGHLGLAELLRPHNEHRLVTTKLFSLGLFAANGQWDNLVEATAAAAVHTLGALMLLLLGCRFLRGGWLGAYGALLALLFALPFAWENTLTGFQVQFYFLLLFALGHIWLTLESDRFSWRWALGQLCGVLGLFTMASGFLSAAAILLVLGWRWATERRLARQPMTTLAIGTALLVAGWFLRHPVPAHDALGTHSAGQFVTMLLRALVWPGPLVLPIVIVPALWAVGRRVRDGHATPLPPLLVGVFLWGVLQSAALVYARGDAPIFASRYLDLFATNVALGFIFLVTESSGRTRRIFAVVWLVAVVAGLGAESRREWRDFVIPMPSRNLTQEKTVREFVAGSNLHGLDGMKWPAIPYIDATRLETLLSNPAIRRSLPVSVRRPVVLPGRETAAPVALPPAFPAPPYPLAVSTYAVPPGHPFVWRSTPQPPGNLPFLRFHLAGDLGRAGANLRLAVKTAAESIPVFPDTIPGTHWKNVTIHRPAGTWWLEASDADGAAWFAVTEPVELGPLSWAVRKALKFHLYFLAAGLLAVGAGFMMRPWRWPKLSSLSLPAWAAALGHRLAALSPGIDDRPCPSQTPSKRTLWALGLIWLLLTLNLGLAVARFQVNVLAWDEWDFYKPLFQGGGWWDIVTYQHGPHRQGLAFLFTSWILHATHWDTRWDSLWIASLLAAAGVLALRLKWKLTGRLTLRDGWIPIFVLSLGQYETILVTPNASHSIFPLALLLLAANLWLATNPWLRWLSAGFAAAALTLTGFGMLVGPVLFVLIAAAAIRHALGRDRINTALAGIALAFAAGGIVIFRWGYIFAPAVANFRFPWTPLTDYVRFSALMLAYPVGVSGETGAHYVVGGAIAFVATLAAIGVGWKWLCTSKPSPTLDVLVLLLGTSLLYVGSTAIGRIPLGVGAGMSSRYVSLMIPLWLALYLIAALSTRRHLATVVSIAMWFVALWPYTDLLRRPIRDWPGTVGQTSEQFTTLEYFNTGKIVWVDTYLRTKSTAEAQAAAGMVVYPSPQATQMDRKIEFLREHRLSFLSATDPAEAYLPWLLRSRAVWDNAYPVTHARHVIDRKTKLVFIAAKPGFAEIPLSAGDWPVDAPWQLGVTSGTRATVLRGRKLPALAAVPVVAGANTIWLTPDRMPMQAGPVDFATEAPAASILVR